MKIRIVLPFLFAATSALAQGFQPIPNGFAFPNYGGEAGATDLTPVEVRRMFGDGACASTAGDTCILTPAAEQWMQEVNKSAGGGHCEGFAALSLLLYTGRLSPAAFGADNTYGLAFAGNGALQREIAYWFATQYVAPVSQAETRTTPSQVVDTLQAAFATGGETYTVGIYQPGYKAGHAVTAYGLRDLGGGRVEILVYDNNYPGVERAITVDRSANTWRYNASTNPNEPSSEYAGDASTLTLGVTATSMRLQPFVCPFCGTGTASGFVARQGAATWRELWLDGKADLLVTDDAGRRFGTTTSGTFVSEILGAALVPVKGDDLWKADNPPVLRLPLAQRLTVTLDGTRLGADSASDVVMVAPGYTLGVEGVLVGPGQSDTLTFSAAGDEISYRTAQSETPVLVLGFETAGADWEFFVKAAGETSGQEADLKLDLAAGRLRVLFRGAADGQSTYDIEGHRIDAAGEQVFRHRGNVLAAGTALWLDYGTWTGDGAAMNASLDQGADGSVDGTVVLSDEP